MEFFPFEDIIYRLGFTFLKNSRIIGTVYFLIIFFMTFINYKTSLFMESKRDFFLHSYCNKLVLHPLQEALSVMLLLRV